MTKKSTEDYHKDLVEKYNNAKKLKRRDKNFEKQILKEAKIKNNDYSLVGFDIAHKYVKHVIKNRWQELEQIYLEINVPNRLIDEINCVHLALDYNNVIIKNRWDKLEDKIIELVKFWGLTEFDPSAIYEYCKNIIKGRWEKLEKIIIDPQYEHFSTRQLYEYSRYVIKGRWIEAEKIIKKDYYWAYCYAKDVIKGRWKEGEEIIKKNHDYAYYYAKDIIKGRWIEGEESIAKGENYLNYKKFISKKIITLLQNKNYEEVLSYYDFKDFANIIKNAEKNYHIPDNIKNVMIANALIGNDDSKKFMMQEKVFKEKMKNYLEKYKGVLVDEVIKSL
jgi:hypothetical protein